MLVVLLVIFHKLTEIAVMKIFHSPEGWNLYDCIRFDSGKLSSAVSDVRQGLEGRLSQWAEYQGSMDRLLAWLSESEMALKNYSTLNNLDEKQDQLNKYQVGFTLSIIIAVGGLTNQLIDTPATVWAYNEILGYWWMWVETIVKCASRGFQAEGLSLYS